MPSLLRSQLRRHHNLLLDQEPISGPVVQKGGGRTAGKKVGRKPAANAHRYWGILISATNETPVSNVDVAELRFFDATGACISNGLTGYAKAGWTANAAKQASDGLSDGLTTTNEIASYAGGSLPMIYWFDFGSPVSAALMQVVGTTEAFNAACPKDYALVYSDDAISWTSVASTTGQTNWQENEDRTLENPNAVPAWTGQNAFSSTEWQIRMEDYYSSYFAWAFSELEFYETIGGAKVTPASMAASSTASGQPASNLIDGNDTTYWASTVVSKNNVFVAATFSTPRKIAQIGLRARNDAGAPADIGRQMPKEIRVEYKVGGVWKYASYLIDPAPSFAAKGELRKYSLKFSR